MEPRFSAKANSLSPSVYKHSQRIKSDQSERYVNTISHDSLPQFSRKYHEPSGPRIIQSTQRQEFKFGDLKDRNDSPKITSLHHHQATSSVNTVEVNGADGISEKSSLPRNPSPLGMPFFHELKEIQQQICSVHASFPMQRNQDFLDHNYEAIIKKAASQLQYLFVKSQRALKSQGRESLIDQHQQLSRDRMLDSSYNQLITDHSQSEMQLLKNSLAKSEEIVLNLRKENEYFQKQLDLLRKEVTVKTRTASQSGSRERISPYRPQTMMNLTNSFEPQQQLAHPKPHPQPVLMQDDLRAFQNSPLKPQFYGNQSSYQPSRNGVNQVDRSQKFSQERSNVNVSMTEKQPQRTQSKSKKSLGRKNDENQDPQSLSMVAEQETRNLKFELQQQTEVLNLKQRMIGNLQQQLESQKRRLVSEAQKVQSELAHENESLKKALAQHKEQQATKDAQLMELKVQCSELVQSKSINLSLLVNRPQPAKTSSKEDKPARSNRNLPMDKRQKKLQFAMDINDEMEQLLAEANHEQAERKRKQKRKQAEPGPSYLPGLMNTENLLRDQIEAAVLAEMLVDEIKQMEAQEQSDAQKLSTQCESLEKHSVVLDTQKKTLETKLADLSKDNDALKQKFSSLLDQFQEYVTFQESKQMSDQERVKQQQESLVLSMQDNIRELEQVTEGLQGELQHKENVFSMLKKECEELELKLAAKNREDNQALSTAMHRLEEEIRFLKRHHEIELTMMREQYERSLETQKLIQEEKQARATSTAGMQYPSLDAQSLLKSETLRISQIQPEHDTLRFSNQTNLYSATNAHALNSTPPSKSRVKEIISTTQNTFDKLKRELVDKELVIEDKNREILKLRMTNEELASKFNLAAGRQFQPGETQAYGTLDPHERRQLVSDLCYLVDSLRAELQRIKTTMFAQIGQRINVDSNHNFQPLMSPIGSEEALQQELLIQMQEMRALLAITGEINLLTVNASPQDARKRSASPSLRHPTSNSAQPGKQNVHDSNYQIKRNADNMLRQNHCSGLHELLLDQITKSETLMQDNALMQRSLYKYETTLAELDIILRNEARDQVIYDLKKLVENQLKQIVSLQKDAHTETSRPVVNPFEARQIDPEQKKDQTIRDLRGANEELLAERRQLMEAIDNLEEQNKTSHRNLEQTLDRVNDLERKLDEKTDELEEIRHKITRVAELFERKEIKQKYSFEVLCDFIYDKAKRLFSKYENVSKDKKVMQEEKNFYFQRKLDQLEQENAQMKEVTRQADRLLRETVPRLAELLERVVTQDEHMSDYIFARQVLEMMEIEHRGLKKNHAVLMERNCELQRILEIYQSRAIGGEVLQQKHHAPHSLQPTIKGTVGDLGKNDYDLKLIQARAQEQEEIFKGQEQLRPGMFNQR